MLMALVTTTARRLRAWAQWRVSRGGRLRASILPLACVLVFGAFQPALAAPGAPLTVRWEANPEAAVIGYVVEVGIAPGVYRERFEVGKTPSFSYPTTVAGQRYYFVVSAYAAGQVFSTRSA